MIHILYVTCISCKFTNQLSFHNKQCDRCRSSVLYKCGEHQCNLMFCSVDELTLHVRQHHLHTWHRCSICGIAIMECAEVMRHRLLQHPKDNETYHHCLQCHYEAVGPDDMSSHVHSTHKITPTMHIQPYRGPYICIACGQIFKLQHRLQTHQRFSCKKICKTYKCAHCRYVGFDKSKLIEHLRYSHVHLYTGKYLSCHGCGMEVTSIVRLNNHVGKCKWAALKGRCAKYT